MRLGHTTETMSVLCFAGAKTLFSDSKMKLVNIGFFECGEYVSIFCLIRQFLLHILALFAHKRPRQERQTMSTKSTFSPSMKVCGRIVKEHNSQTGQNLDPKMALFRTKSSMIHADLAKKSIHVQDNMAKR